MSCARAIVRNEWRLVAKDPFPVIILIVMPLVLLAFLSKGLVGGPARSVPGLAVLFGFFGVSSVGIAFYRDHGWNTWDHFRVSGCRPGEIVLAKTLPLVVLFLAQQAVLLVAGWLVFAMPWRGSILAGCVMALSIVATEVTLGLLLATICKSIYHVTTIANLGALLIAGLGGGLAPVSTLPSWVQDLAPASPAYWALKGFRAVIAVDGGVADVAVPSLVLSAWTVASVAIVLWRFRIDEPKTFFA